jgi:hypothetical protein
MSNTLEFIWVGHSTEPTKTGGYSDKIWTSFKVGNAFYCAWGARGKSVSFKKHDSRWTLNDVQRKKEKTYTKVNQIELFKICPDFYDCVEQSLCFAILANKIR